ncbi:MAG TPA: glycoside hydrolase family 6 protein [Gemmatimonadaceae bacterium]|nr:glycoside hydrolase family 6 protein [Gemmatimonadaceae bacterium]
MKRNRSGRARIARVSRNVAIATIASLAAVQAAVAVAPSVVNELNNLAGMRLFVSGDSPAKRQADTWRRSRPADAELMDRIAKQPMAKWFGGWSGDIRRAVAGAMDQAAHQGSTPVLVAYNIPNRDCGSYSAGGSSNGNAYREWIRGFAAGLSGRRAIVVLEPDAIPGAACLPAAGQQERYSLLADAVRTLKSAGAVVYLDAGNSKWLAPSAVAQRLQSAGIEQADGFSLNVSNYQTTSSNVTYGNSLSKLVGGKHYVIDTSRNGVGGSGSQWCNVSGQSLGAAPTTKTGYALVDAFLWIKTPGESDGTCNGGPKAGQWWPEYALGLAKNAVQVASAN